MNMEVKLLSLLSWFLSFIFGVLTLLTSIQTWTLRPSDAQCAKRWSIWSPVDRGEKQSWKMFPDLTLFSKSEFFGTNFQDIDAAWDTYLPNHPIAIPTSRLNDLKIPSNGPYIHPPRVESSVLAIPEAFVQLQCLNLLRKHLAQYTEGVDYSHQAGFTGSKEIVMHRADLCIERLRNMVMCWSDLGTILQPLVEEPGKQPRSLLDFATRHKCHDFSSIREWTKENAVRAVRMNDAWWGGRVFE